MTQPNNSRDMKNVSELIDVVDECCCCMLDAGSRAIREAVAHIKGSRTFNSLKQMVLDLGSAADRGSKQSNFNEENPYGKSGI